MTRFNRILAAPLIAAGIFSATLGVASTASAAITKNSDGSMVATPDISARQEQMPLMIRAMQPEPVPQFDNTVHG